MRKQFDFIVADRRGILAQIAGAENAARKLRKLLGFYSAEKPQADLGTISDLLQGDVCRLGLCGRRGLYAGRVRKILLHGCRKRRYVRRCGARVLPHLAADP